MATDWNAALASIAGARQVLAGLPRDDIDSSPVPRDVFTEVLKLGNEIGEWDRVIKGRPSPEVLSAQNQALAYAWGRESDAGALEDGPGDASGFAVYFVDYADPDTIRTVMRSALAAAYQAYQARH